MYRSWYVLGNERQADREGYPEVAEAFKRYAWEEADTTYGKVGVKAWVYNGEVLPTKGNKEGSDK